MVSVGGIASQGKLRLERARARHGWVDIAVRLFKRFGEDEGGIHAAALTYYVFLSVFPLLLFVASGIGYLTFLSPDVRDSLATSGLDTFPLLATILDPATLDTLQEQRGTLAIVGLVLALYSGTGAVVGLEHALNHIDRAPEGPGWLRQRLASLRWLVMLGVAGIVSLGLGALAGYAGRVFDAVPAAGELVAALLGHAAGILVGLAIFVTAFRFLPARARSLREVLPGAAAAALAFEVLKIGGAWYLERGSQSREATFGAFAASAGLLVASYLLAQTTLLSAELNAVLAERRALRTASRPEPS